MNFTVQEYRPMPALAPFIECFWQGTFNISAEKESWFHMVPNGCMELIIHLDDLHCTLPQGTEWNATPDYMLIGLSTCTKPIRFTGTVPVFTIRFKPEALMRLFQLPGTAFYERFEDMSLVLDKDFESFCNHLREQLSVKDRIAKAERYLLQRLNRQKRGLEYVEKAANLIRTAHDMAIEDIAENVCISKRQLERKFREAVGVSPKQYLRLSRINRVMRLLAQKQTLDLSSVAYYCGYFDQAHFIKDFKRITGQKPTLFHRERQQYIVLPGQVNMKSNEY